MDPWSDKRPLLYASPHFLLNYCNVFETINGLSYSQARVLSPLTLLISTEESQALLSEHIWKTSILENFALHLLFLMPSSMGRSQRWWVAPSGPPATDLHPKMKKNYWKRGSCDINFTRTVLHPSTYHNQRDIPYFHDSSCVLLL